MIPGASTLALWAALASAAPPPVTTPTILLRSAQCLVAKGFLPPTQASEMSLGYYTDDTSYPGERVIYVVAYTAADRTRGAAFAVFASKAHGGLELSIQNNTTFVVDGSAAWGLDFVNPPLGGAWTQQHLARGIRRAAARPIYRVAVGQARRGVAGTICSAYTDPRPGSGD